MTRKEIILGTITDLVADFLYYDREECEDLPQGEIEESLATDEITVEEMAEQFRLAIEERL